VRANKGARTAGIDGVAPRSVGLRAGEMLDRLRDDLKAGRFVPQQVREKAIPKTSGKIRRLGIPTTVDRVVQAALKLVLEPIFEADFKPCSYGFRPRRRAQDAIAEIHFLASPTRNYEWVFEADIKACFDEIDHTLSGSRWPGGDVVGREMREVVGVLEAAAGLAPVERTPRSIRASSSTGRSRPWRVCTDRHQHGRHRHLRVRRRSRAVASRLPGDQQTHSRQRHAGRCRRVPLRLLASRRRRAPSRFRHDHQRRVVSDGPQGNPLDHVQRLGAEHAETPGGRPSSRNREVTSTKKQLVVCLHNG